MTKKKRTLITIELVKEFVESQDYILISNIYESMHKKIDLVCPDGHFYSTSFSNFRNNGARCPECKNCKRKTLDEVKKIFKDKGYTLMAEVYKNNHTKMLSICPEGHEYNVTLNAFHQAENRCPLCQEKSIYTYETAKKIFDDKGYILINTVYNNAREVLNTTCPQGDLYRVGLYDFIKGATCPKCSNLKMGSNPYTIEEVKKIFSDRGYTLLSTEYQNAHQKLKVTCAGAEKHEIEMTLNGFKDAGSDCAKCEQREKYTIDFVKGYLEGKGYILISTEYPGVHHKMLAKCPKGTYWEFTFANFKNHERRCPCCSESGTSKPEKEIFEFIRSLCPDTIGNTYEIIGPYELDIYIPSLNVAVEYCGFYYHSEKFKKDRSYHLNKMRLCNEKGIRLITVFEDEWLEREDQVKNFLLSAINKNNMRIMGRKTEIQKVPKEEAIRFLDKTHIQGSPVFEIAFGLYYNNELVGVTTGNKHHRQGHEDLFVLNRLAFKSNVSVSGGSSKLLKALIQYARENGYSKLISWSDNRWSEGNVYKKLNFELTQEFPPDYSYVLREKRFSKQSCQKKNLIKKGAIGSTESEMALSLGLRRIWDCGKKRWEINLS